MQQKSTIQCATHRPAQCKRTDINELINNGHQQSKEQQPLLLLLAKKRLLLPRKKEHPLTGRKTTGRVQPCSTAIELHSEVKPLVTVAARAGHLIASPRRTIVRQDILSGKEICSLLPSFFVRLIRVEKDEQRKNSTEWV